MMKANVLRWRRIYPKLVPYIYLLPAFIIGGIVLVYPLLNGVILSFTDYTLINPVYEWNGFQNYISLFKDSMYWEVFFNSIFIIFIAVIIQLTLGLIIAILFNTKFPLRGVFRSSVFMIWIIPMMVISLLWLTIYNSEFGLLNDTLIKIGIIKDKIFWLGSIWPAKFAIIATYGWRGIPFFMVMILAAIQTIPEDIIDASKIDGANNLQRFRFITIPYIKHIVILCCLLSVVRLFQDITLIFILTGGGPINSTTTFSIHVYKTAFQNLDLSKAATIGVTWLIFLSIFAVIYVKKIMKKD